MADLGQANPVDRENWKTVDETSELLTAGDFRAFFRDVHGYSPFPWQERLARQVIDHGVWPKVIDLPTGTGKTAVLDTAVFAMAARPERSPRRVVFVIDRRIVVDQVCKRALRIRDCVKSGKTIILRRIRERLGCLSDAREPLGVASLRGGVPIDNEWTHRPDQPWVIVSTVDQFGSRLLFRGYGVTPSMRPVHAGLAGQDCIVILDEVHLSVPFAQTLGHVAALDPGTLPRRFSIVEMSATPSDKNAERFQLDPVADLEECDELRRRVRAAKLARLVSVRDHNCLPSAIVKIVKSITAQSRSGSMVRSVGVVVNRVGTARETHRSLEESGLSTFLITGRMRPLDRIDVLAELGPTIDPDVDCDRSEPIVVVATQAIEVGADFSFDALVTECAPVDSLRQRFGRLARRGRLACAGAPAQAWILGPKSIVASKKPDPIYGEATKKTWEELEQRAMAGLIGVGPLELSGFPDSAFAPRLDAPLLLRTHMNAWTQTQPEPVVQPPLDWFLHGIDLDRVANPDVSLLWRFDRTTEVLRLVPPRQAEFLQVPIGAVKSWLSGGAAMEITDVGSPGAEPGESLQRGIDRVADFVRWEGFGREPDGRVSVNEIRPGDVLIVDPGFGGLRAGSWDPSSSEQVTDLGDAAQVAVGHRATLRLDSRLLDTPSLPKPSDEVEADSSATKRISEWLDHWLRSECGDQGDWFSNSIRRLRDGFDITAVGLDDETPTRGYWVLIERHSLTKKPVVDAGTMDGSDESGSLIGTQVSLRRHLDGVGNRAGNIAQKLGLASEFVDDLRLAGRLHDVGKVDRRFQAELVGDDPVALEMLEEPLAKSLPDARRVRRYPKGMRHEIASVAMLESNYSVLNAAHDRDLVLHLVGTHHGWARPLAPIIGDPEPQTLRYSFDGSEMIVGSDLAESTLALDMADRFWRLVERFGYYGLAWLEAILRLADHQQSAEEASLP